MPKVTAPVNLGTAGDFAILAKSGISSVPNSVITGDIGVSPIAASAVDQLATVRARHAYKLAGTVRDRQLAPGQGKPVEGRVHFTNVRQ